MSIDLIEPNQLKKISSMMREPFGRKLIMSLCKYTDIAVSGDNLSTETDAPLSSVYKHLHDLQEVGLVYHSKTVRTPKNKPVKFYRSRFKMITLICDPSGIKLVIS